MEKDGKKEIVFFPYKASMWDSLESIWMAARDDENCEVYVVPIPYYDKHSDGTIKEWYYEGNEYPDYVPVTSWEDYELADRKPDEAYIHNPYDDCNLVTSVHPRYYSSELKKYVGKLIYSPYFVALGDLKEHLITTPGVMNADIVLVQSEKIKQTYMRVYMEYAGVEQKRLENRTGKRNREYWERLQKAADEKFRVLASPKLEKVERSKRENITIPDEWLRLMTDKAGKRKTVILYNTTVEGVLKHSESYIKKLETVLRQFRRNQDVLLWWRPHPLLQSSLDAMRPALAGQYRRITKRYRSEGWGIFDDTPDVTRAVMETDAYYGDWSSVVKLYEATGKPIMIQDTKLVEE